MTGVANIYAYVGGNPISLSDPLGLEGTSVVQQMVQQAAQAVVMATGGCSNQSFIDDSFNNFTNVNETIGWYRFGLTVGFGSAFANTYGGLTPIQAAVRGVGFRTGVQAVGTIGGTMAINAVLIGGMFQAGNLVGSFGRTAVNRGAAALSCGCP